MVSLTKLTDEETESRELIGEPTNLYLPPIDGETDEHYTDRVNRYTQAFSPSDAKAFSSRYGKPDLVLVEVKRSLSPLEAKRIGKRVPMFIIDDDNFAQETWLAQPTQYFK